MILNSITSHRVRCLETAVAPSAATLSSPIPSGTLGTTTTAITGATTNQASGIFYCVVDSAANLVGVTASQIKLGQNKNGSAAVAAANAAVAGVSPSASLSGLVSSTLYSYACVQTNSGGDSNVVTGTFTTGASAGSVFFTEDFAAGYTWGAMPVTSVTTVRAQIGVNWQFIDFSSGHGAIDAWPPDTSKRAFRRQYVNSDDLDVIQHKFDPTHANGASRPTEIWWQWLEYRSSTFDFGPSKDFRIGVYRVNEYGGLAGGTIVDVYGGFTNSSASGVGACTTAGVNLQGAGYQPQVGGGGGTDGIIVANFVMARATVYKYELHLKINSPGNFDGAAELYANGILIKGRTDVKITPDSWTQGYIDFIQHGMTATNGGQAFADTSYIWIKDVKIATGYIG